ncbi:MAG: dethiobiotin synthase [Rhodocyclales bacterium]|jgi:dethiobiotin synthetase|nr:dethiobiotin synthase [Rhodocyclales bacterium]
MSAQFITGTGTDIGKTWLACALLRHWRAEGRRVAAFKPVLSGFDPAHPAASDAGALLAALGREAGAAELDAIAPWRFAAPLSPDMAAALEGREIDFDALVAFSRRAVSADFHAPLVEGVGGVMAPLDGTHTVRDWIAASGLPCVLVSGSYLGSLSHTLTALEALAKVGAGVTAIVVNESPDSAVALDATLRSLARHAAGIPLVGVVRADPGEGIALLAGLLS